MNLYHLNEALCHNRLFGFKLTPKLKWILCIGSIFKNAEKMVSTRYHTSGYMPLPDTLYHSERKGSTLAMYVQRLHSLHFPVTTAIKSISTK